MTAPSGRQIALRRGAARAVVTEVGAGIRTLAVDGVAVLDGFAADAVCDGARGQPLLPWPNRVADGRYAWDGVPQQLALTEPERSTAIHGLTRWVPWQVLARSAATVHLRYRLPAQPGWPFLLCCDVRYAVTGSGLDVTTVLTNVGLTPCPAAAGQHPYLSAGGGPGPGGPVAGGPTHGAPVEGGPVEGGPVGASPVDACRLQLGADTELLADGRGMPTGRRPVAGTAVDFRVGRDIGPQVLDSTLTDLHRDADGLAVVRLARPDGVTVRLWAGPGYGYLQVFTGDTLAPARRRRGLAVEPMTAPPNALQSGTDLLRLDPGRSVELRWGVGLG